MADNCSHYGCGRPHYGDRMAELTYAIEVLKKRVLEGIADESDVAAARELNPYYAE